MAVAENELVLPGDPRWIDPAFLAREADPRWKQPTHIEIMLDEILECIATPNGRLIIEAPPRHGKSDTTSKVIPSWYLCTHPHQRVILASYEAEFAESWGRKVRDVVTMFGPQLYGVRPREDSSAVSRWELEKYMGADKGWVPTGGGMVTAGVGGPITGRGANLFLIDDPIKNNEEAMSVKIRQKIWDWWQSTAGTRFEPDASAIIIMTRWHEDDLVGRLLREMLEDESAERWKIISFPATYQPIPEDDIKHEIAERFPELIVKDFRKKRGQALWRDRFNEEALARNRRRSGIFWWSAMYQQIPKPPEGLGTFKREWFSYVDEAPNEPFTQVRYWDLAATKPKDPNHDPDWTAGALMSRTNTGTYLEHMIRWRETPQRTEEQIVATASMDGKHIPIRFEVEPGSAGIQLVDHYKRLLYGWDVRGIKTTGSKELRAGPLASEAEAGRLFLVSAGWNRDFVDEAVAFPYGAHDDQVDAASGAFSFLATEDPNDVVPWGLDRSSPWKI